MEKLKKIEQIMDQLFSIKSYKVFTPMEFIVHSILTIVLLIVVGGMYLTLCVFDYCVDKIRKYMFE